MFARLGFWILPIIAAVAIAGWMMSSAETDLQPSVALQSNGPTSYYVFNNGRTTDVFEGSQFFSEVDQIGVNKVIEDALPNHGSDFVTIGSNNADRSQYLTNQGHVLETPPNSWNVIVSDMGVVGGETRLAVGAILGKNISQNGGIAEHHEAYVYEIWKLNAGAAPMLLERTNQIQEGVFTTAEHPPENLTWPAGIAISGEPDFMGN